MVDLPGPVLDAIAGAMLSFVASAVAFRVAMERRLSRLEKDAEHFSPRELEARIRMLETEAESLEPIRELLDQYGQEAARRVFEGGFQR